MGLLEARQVRGDVKTRKEVSMKNRYWARSLVLVFALSATTLSANAQAERQATIDVQGSADVKVVPDEVFIAFGVETSDPSLTASKTQNDERVKRLLALTKEMSIDPKYVQTDFISIEPWEHQLNDEKRTVRVEYRVRKNIAVTLKDVPSFEELLSRALEAGVNHVHGIQFRTTELRKHRDHINEYSGGMYSPYGWWGQGSYYGSNAMSQVSSQSGDAASADGTIALGQITVTASVSVTFALQ
jgi:uncharacterized protein YggE